MKSSVSTLLVPLAGLAVMAGSTVASAGIVGDAFVITATNANGTDSFSIPQSSLQWSNDTQSWVFETSGGWSESMSNGVTLTSISTEYVEDPMIFFNFGGSTGGVATVFTVTSATLTFGALLNPTGYASSGLTLTDNNSGGGASMIGYHAGGNAYKAVYNGASVFASQTASFNVVNPNGTLTNGGNLLGVVIPGAVASMQAQWNFEVSADDSFGATSTWVVVPAPGAMGLLGLGGLLIARRRR